MKVIKFFLKILLFTNKEVSYCLAHYVSDQPTRGIWFIRNIVTPLIYILLPLFGLMINQNKYFTEIIFNGGISLLAINIAVVMITYLRIESNGKISNEYPGDAGIIKKDIISIQTGLIDRAQLFIAVSVILYFIQSIYPFPFINNWVSGLFIFILFTTTISSIILGYLMFTLRDDEDNFKRIYNILNLERKKDSLRLQKQTSVDGFNQSLSE